MCHPPDTAGLTPDLVFSMAAIAGGAPVASQDMDALVTAGLAIAPRLYLSEADPEGLPRPAELTAAGLKAATVALSELSPLMRAVAFAADLARQELPANCDDLPVRA